MDQLTEDLHAAAAVMRDPDSVVLRVHHLFETQDGMAIWDVAAFGVQRACLEGSPKLALYRQGVRGFDLSERSGRAQRALDAVNPFVTLTMALEAGAAVDVIELAIRARALEVEGVHGDPGQ